MAERACRIRRWRASRFCASIFRVSGTPPRASATRIMLRYIGLKVDVSRAIASSSDAPRLMASCMRRITGPRAVPPNCFSRLLSDRMMSTPAFRYEANCRLNCAS